MKIPFSLLKRLPSDLKNLSRYKEYYDESKLKNKLVRSGIAIGQVATEEFLSLYYLLKGEGLPLTTKEKAMLVGCLGYFILPIDIIPDFLFTLAGFSDDLAVAAIVMSVLGAKVTPNVRAKAHAKAIKLFSCNKLAAKAQ
ncbi:YkvA family protein [Porphyromonas pogonae]|uniref:YkvA family protein n=1 Tax=Porphyromonas pogonae TaxID=867595 RepID=UPI002E75A300|nr:DUF1232 domain-containing protein [Porphyromonas pogonae]